MLEVSASWLFHAAMNILWERKYFVSDSFYSAATHRAGNLPDRSQLAGAFTDYHWVGLSWNKVRRDRARK